MIAAARTGPTPFNVSSVASSAVLMLTRVVGPPGTPPAIGAPVGGAAPFFGTRICCPSVSGAARLSRVRSAFSSAPPARSTASITRSPGTNSNTPGLRTAPATSTINVGAALIDADGGTDPDATASAPDGDAPNDVCGAGAADPAVVATSTGRGNDRVYQSPTPASSATTTTI